MHSSINLSPKNLLGFITFLSLQNHAHCSLSVQTMAPRLFVPAVDSDPQTITAAPTLAPTLDERDDLKDEQIAAWFSRPGVDNWAQIICESPSAYTSSGAFGGCWKTTDSTVVLPTGCSNNYVQYPKQSSTACTGDNKCGVFTIFASQSATATSHLFYECLPTDWDPPIPATWYRTTWPSISVPEPTSTSRLTSITTKTKFKTVTSSSATPTSKPTPTTSSTSTSVPGSQAAITPISIDSRTATSRTTFGFGLGSTSVAPSTTASGTSAGSRQIRPMLNLGDICSINVILMWVFLG